MPERIRIVYDGVTLADSMGCYRVLETSHPPVYYIPQADIRMDLVTRSARRSSFCEWKGSATYWTVGENVDVGWCYESPTPAFRAIAGYIAFYAGPMDGCYVGEEKVTPQPGGFYGGWITKNLKGPFKGAPGSLGW